LNHPDRRLRAVSIAPAAKDWLARTQQATVLYAFETVVNLINQEADVLSLVDARIGNGPFSLVLEEGAFPAGTKAEASLLVFENGFWLDDWLIDAEEAALWQPQPNWAALHTQPIDWAIAEIEALLRQHAEPDSLARLVLDPTAVSPLPARILQAAEQNIPLLYSGLATNDGLRISEAAKKLAGLGPGLTPAGDDLLLGAMHGLWARLPAEAAAPGARRIANAAAPRTHALSAAWLEAGARGEAAEPWHQLAAAFSAHDSSALGAAVMRILPTGHTSGSDALGGFVGALREVAA
jgi:hypothetical protein